MMDLTLRLVQENDVPSVARYIDECAALESFVETTTEAELQHRLHDPVHPVRFMMALARDEQGDERVVGEMQYHFRPQGTHAWAYLHVHPAFRRRGVGTALYNELLEHRRRTGEPEPVFYHDIAATCLADFVLKRGYEFDRNGWRMRLPQEVEVPAPEVPAWLTIRNFVPGQDEELLMRVRNASFAEHYGSSPRTLDDIIFMTQELRFRPEHVYLALDGQEPAGFCLGSIDAEECARRGVKVGWIGLLGTVPAYRGKGVGRVLLLTGVRSLRRDVEIVELGVEGENHTAIQLYESVGFFKESGRSNFKKSPRPQGGS